MHQFDDIRPYSDAEVRSVVSRLIEDKELQHALALFKFPRLAKWAPALTRAIIAKYLQHRARSVHSVRDLQMQLEKFINRILLKTTDSFTTSGLDELDLSKPTLFVSNHRDIVLDPALVNLALHRAGSDTLTIATGDNLFSKPWVSDLLRLNRSFIVKRKAANRRELLNNSKVLSAFIDQCVHKQKNHVWIAQREGRAKDGIDKTNPAIVSMLLLNKDKTEALSDYITRYNIVPVSISYEYDPCDTSKTIELDARATHGTYEKNDQEDIESINKGIMGYKGMVHVAFGTPLSGEFANNNDVAQTIDKQIINLFKLFPTHQKAAQALKEDKALHHPLLNTRMEGLSTSQSTIFLEMYANPVFAKNKQKINNQPQQ